MLILILATAFGSAIENFGEITSPCGSAWVDYCEQDWSASGDVASSDMCEESGNQSIGVLITGRQGSFPNGVERTFAVPAGESFARFTSRFMAMDSANVVQRMLFLDSSGQVLHTRMRTYSVAPGSYLRSFAAHVPPGVAGVKLQFGVGGSNGPLVFLDQTELTYPQGEDDDGGGVIEGVECSQTECTAAAADHCATEDVCAGVSCTGETPTAVCSGICDYGACFIDATCSCVEDLLIGFSCTLAPPQ